jgi:APA family basic amino acid/polyamine antiporter
VSSAFVTLLLLANQKASMIGLIQFMALVSTFAVLVAYLASGFAALKLQAERRMERSPALLAACCLGLTFACWAVYGAGLQPVMAGGALIVLGVPVYFYTRFRTPGRGGRTYSPASEG